MEFSDGTDIIDGSQWDTVQPVTTPEIVDQLPQEQENQSSSSVPLPTAPPDQEQTEVSDEVQPETVVTPEPSVTPEISYEKLVEEIKNQTEEIKAIQEKNEEHFQTYEHLGFASVAGIGLLFGGICALIMSQYIRH